MAHQSSTTGPPDPRPDPRAELGRWGEQVAVDHLEAAGLVVLERNWRCREGELDIVASEVTAGGTTVVFVEVKTRSGTGFGRPAEAVTPRKLQRLRRLSQRWLAEHRVGWVEVRFDVVAVLADRATGTTDVEHLRGVS